MSARAARHIEDHQPIPAIQPVAAPTSLKSITSVTTEAVMHPYNTVSATLIAGISATSARSNLLAARSAGQQ